MNAYAQATSDDETFKLTVFSSDDKFFAFSGGFHGLKSLQKVFYATFVSLFGNIDPPKVRAGFCC